MSAGFDLEQIIERLANLYGRDEARLLERIFSTVGRSPARSSSSAAYATSFKEDPKTRFGILCPLRLATRSNEIVQSAEKHIGTVHKNTVTHA